MLLLCLFVVYLFICYFVLLLFVLCSVHSIFPFCYLLLAFCFPEFVVSSLPSSFFLSLFLGNTGASANNECLVARCSERLSVVLCSVHSIFPFCYLLLAFCFPEFVVSSLPSSIFLSLFLGNTGASANNECPVT